MDQFDDWAPVADEITAWENESARRDRIWERGRSLMRHYGLMGTNDEVKARAGVLDRMGAFNAGEYADLMRFLNASSEELGL